MSAFFEKNRQKSFDQSETTGECLQEDEAKSSKILERMSRGTGFGPMGAWSRTEVILGNWRRCVTG
jgi:hypothetical protein